MVNNGTPKMVGFSWKIYLSMDDKSELDELGSTPILGTSTYTNSCILIILPTVWEIWG